MKLTAKFWGYFLELGFIVLALLYLKFSMQTILDLEGSLQKTLGMYGFKASMLTSEVYIWYLSTWIIGAAMTLIFLYIGFLIGGQLRQGLIFSLVSQQYFKRLKMLMIAMILFAIPNSILSIKLLSPQLASTPNYTLGLIFMSVGFAIIYSIIAAFASLINKGSQLQRNSDLTI